MYLFLAAVIITSVFYTDIRFGHFSYISLDEWIIMSFLAFTLNFLYISLQFKYLDILLIFSGHGYAVYYGVVDTKGGLV